MPSTPLTRAGVITALTLIAAAILLHLTFTPTRAPNAFPAWELALALTWASGAALLHWNRNRNRTTGHHRRTPRRATRLTHPTLTITGCTLVLSAASLIGAWISLSLPLTHDAALSSITHLTRHSGSALILLIALAILAGAAEEWFFRIELAHLAHGWARWVIPTLLYTAVTAASGNPMLTLAAPIVGIAATAAHEWSGRWIAPFVVHLGWSLTMLGLFPVLAVAIHPALN